MNGVTLIQNYNSKNRVEKQHINSMFGDQNNEDENVSQFNRRCGVGESGETTKKSFMALDALGRPMSTIGFDQDTMPHNRSGLGVSNPYTPLDNPSTLSSYLGGTNCTAYQNLNQLQALQEEEIFDRPLDPTLQSGTGSNLPTNAKMSIVTADSDVIREQIKTANLR